MIKFLLTLLVPLLLFSEDYYPKLDVCKSLGINTETIKSSDLKSVCIDFVPTTLQKKTVLDAIDNAGENFQYIVDELRRAGMPDAIIFLAATESNFSSKYSNRGTYAGVWQLSKFEAQIFGLVVNPKRKIDERKDVEKSTSAMIKLLQENYKEFGNWPLAIIAFNAGKFRIQNAINRAGTKNIETLLYSQKKYLPNTTSNYLKRIIIYATAANYPPVYDRINYKFKKFEYHEDRNETNISH